LRRGYHVGNLRARILDSAGEMLEEAGPSGPNLRALAERIGITAGSLYHHFDSKAGVDGSRALVLIEDAFSKKLVKGWWDGFDFSAAYISDSYRAGAFVSRMSGEGVGAFDYLDKFAVLEDARGEGLARTVWRRFTAEHPSFFWRSRSENGFNAFYANDADGSVKRGGWTIFWKGESDFARIAKIVDQVAALPESFEDDV